MTMKVVIIADPIDSQYAGIHTYTKGMVEALAADNNGNTFYVIRKDQNVSVEGMEIVLSKKSGRSARNPIRKYRDIPAAIKSIDPDVVVEPAHFGPVNIPSRIRRITVIHDLSPILFPKFHGLSSKAAHRFILPDILKKTDSVVVNSNCTRSDVERIYPFTKDKVEVIYPGVFDFSAINADISILEKHRINEPFLLFVGTLEPRKNLLFLLDVYSLVRQKNTKIKLVISGKSGWKNKAFLRKHRNHPFVDDIILTGFISREKQKALYENANVFVFPSLYEGFGFPVLEALSFGLPCVVSDRGSIPEVTNGHAKISGITHASDFSNSIIEAFLDRKEKEQTQNRMSYASSFSWKKFAEEFNALLERLH